MLSESQVIANKLQCQLSKSVPELLQIESINKNEYGIFRIKKEHLIKFDEFSDYTLDQDVLVYIDKKVRNQYIMKLKYEKNFDVEQYVIEGRNYVYIRTQLVNMQNKKEIINLHLLNIYQQGSIKQLIQETLNGVQFSFKFIDQQDYFVQIIFATLFENEFKGTNLQVANLVQEIQKNYMSCSINECKKDKEFSLSLQNIQFQQIPPLFIKECSLKTSQSIQYYQQINSIYAANIELEKDEIQFNIDFTLECIKLMSSNEERNHIKMEYDQYFCINNLIYHFRFISIQNYQRFNYYVILLQVKNDINQNKLIEDLFNLILNLKCQKEIQITNDNLEKLIQMNSSFIQQQQNQNNKELKTQDNYDTKVFVEENINIQIDEEYQQINKQSKLLQPNNDENSESLQFIQINQSFGSTPQLLEIKQDLPLEEDQINVEQQQFEMKQIINDDIFDQPLQLEEQQHQQRLNQVNQYEKKTQEIEESINFEKSDNQQYQDQKIENVVFDEYNQQQQQKQDLEYPIHQSNLNKQSNKEEVLKQDKNVIKNQSYENHQNRYKIQDNYDEYQSHQRHHHRHHSEQYRGTQYEYDQLYEEQEQEQERHHHHHHHHHHHQFHHHNYQYDNEFKENENQNLRGFGVDSKRNNLRGRNNRDYSLSDNNNPEIIDRIIIEYNFQQRENDDTQQQQGNSQKKDHKKENPIAGPKKQQIQYDKDQTQSQNNDSNENNKSNNKPLSKKKKIQEEEDDEQENDNKTQQDKPKTLSAQKQNNKDKDNQQQQKVRDTNKTNKEESDQKEEEEIDQDNTNTEDDEDKKIKQKKKQNDSDDKDNEDENQNKDEIEESNEREQNKEEDIQEQDEQEQDEQNEEDQNNQQKQKKSKTKKQQNKEKDDNKKQKQSKKESKKQQDEEEENVENENEDELYDFNGRYIPNDPFYEHRKSKRGRYPFNYPTNDPYQEIFGNERFWRYETMKRQQVRYPFNGYPYRHRKQTVDHSPFPHVNSYYKMHPFQQQTYHCSPWVGRDFYPDTGYGMSRVTAAYKGRYTDPDQVLRDLTIKQQQQKQWKTSVQQYRDQVGYKYADYDLDFQPHYSQSYEDIIQQYPDYDHTIFDSTQFQPYEDKSNKTHDFLNDPSFQFRQGKKPLDKKNQITTFNPQQFDENDCFVVYDQCNFQGNRLDLCGEYPDIPQYINGFKIFSFIVPDNLSIRFFQSTDFQNNIENVEGTSDCLKVPYELVPNIQQ
ncbi:unnamed protein product [Paramecium sonneborni]|uniref:Uncharacterized protein n=1 Tax=Paramecium sonneborni TaxID=65129 RepID=A0A8S1LBL2_9CILI|nr:unnamed protein product [Paramecium sonneborni]